MAELAVPGAARCELILGGQKSGKSRRAEMLAAAWCDRSTAHGAVLIATAQAGDAEMAARIARHRQDRAARAPRLRTAEEAFDLPGAILLHSRAQTLVVVDCLTLWLTHLLMPLDAAAPAGGTAQGIDYERASRRGQLLPDAPVDVAVHVERLLSAIAAAPGPLILVGNEIGLGVIPLGREVRAFVDALGQLNQSVAQACSRVVLMAAGLPLVLKEGA